ncbi:MAG: fatty acid desaturase [Acidimicrobiia bacterium]
MIAIQNVAGPAAGRAAYTELHDTKLGAVRAAFSPGVYQRSNVRAVGALAIDTTLFVASVAGALLVPWLPARLGLGLLAGLFVAALFVWGHDAAHGALFGDGRLAEVLGTIAMLPSLSMYQLWIYGHNRAHHGFTSYSPVDWIWRPMTPEQYAAASGWSRFVYRCERSVAGPGLHYLLRVWWPGMVRFRPNGELRRRYHVTRSKLIVLAYVIGASTVAWIVGGGPVGVLVAVFVPWAVFTYMIGLMVYLHHTHPALPLFDDRKEWSATIGQVACSTIVRTSKPFGLLTHHIMVHTPHHVDARIPFYRLEQAYADLKPDYGRYILEYRLRWSTLRSIAAACELYDYRHHTWHRFDELPQLVKPVAAFSAPAER